MTEQIDGLRLERRLDSGGRHAVWLARDAAGRAVALKRGGAPCGPDAAPIDGLVAVLARGTDADGLPYQVMPLVTGDLLADRLAAGPLEPAERASVIVALTATLAKLHDAGGAHGDLRAANVVLGPRGEVTILDREIRRAATPERDREALAALERAL